jgi:hypothetical protein
MLVLMTLHCEQCGHDNDSRYRFCGMCGAKLPLPARDMEPSRTDSPDRDPAPPTKPVSGPSFLGLADEPDPVSYLLEDDPSTSHPGRLLVLAVFLAGTVAAGWHWRQDLRSLTSRFTGAQPVIQSQQTQSQQTTNVAPAAASPSETQAPPGGTPLAVPQTDAAASNQAAPTSIPSASPTTQPAAPAGDQAPTGVSTSTSAAPGGGPAPTASSQQPQPNSPPAPAATGDSSQPANSDSKEQASANQPSSTEETPPAKPRATVKASRNSTEQVPAGSESDALESQGEKYLYGTGVPANCALAHRSLLAAAEHSNSKAQSVLGTMYATGHCATRDLPLAYRWFARALRQDPNNIRIQDDLKVLWNQMGPDERQLALRAER